MSSSTAKRLGVPATALWIVFLGASVSFADGRSAAAKETAGNLPSIPFVDVTRDVGVDFVHRSGATGEKLLPETMGGGVALFDFDGDHDADLLLVQSAGAPVAKLYRNDAGNQPGAEAGSAGELRFVDVTAATGLDQLDPEAFYGMGVAVADVDADGDLDVFLTGVGSDRLLRNDEVKGRRRFVDVTSESGVGGAAEAWSAGAAFFDADGDHDLDLLVVRYVDWSKDIETKLNFRLEGLGRAYGPPQEYGGTLPALYLNRGDGSFVDATAGSGLEVVDAEGKPAAKALAVLPIDADADGRMDVLVANDTVRNFFFRNLGPSDSPSRPVPVRFEEVAEFYGLAYDNDGKATGAMGVDAGHYRNDGNLAFLVGNYSGETSSILRAQDDPEFYVDEAMKEGLGAPTRARLTFGAFFFDADLDGRLDVLHANGHVEPDIARVDKTQRYRQPGQLFWNAGGGLVLLSDEQIGDLAREIPGRGAAYADLDLDGDLDVVLTQIDGPPLVLRNEQQLGNHWLRVRLEPPHLAVGARVELIAGGVTQVRHVMPTRSYLSQVEAAVTFGLGRAQKVDSLRIVWPDGSTQVAEVDGVDRDVVIAPE